MYMATGSPLRGGALCRLQSFLRSCELDYDESITFTATLMEEDEILATASLDGSTVKCVAVSPAHQGEDLAARVLTEVVSEASRRGLKHLMLYTKPHNQYLFEPLGFHTVIRTPGVLLMENHRRGLEHFLASIPRPEGAPVGCIVANCNPFTRGHRHLIEQAAKECAWVHVFILSEERGLFAAKDRLRMAQEGCRDLANVLIHPTGPYMVSSSTFPTYFIKDKARTGDIHCELDLRLFGEKIAPELKITRRYVGTEPGCEVTAHYNARMKEILPGYGVEVVENERKEAEGQPISASRVRRLIAENRFDELEPLLPESSIALIQSSKGDLPCHTPTECKGT